MAVKAKSEPECTQVSVQWNIGGKVAIEEYGAVTSNYGASMSRTFTIPADWTQEQIDDFQIEERQRLEDLLEPIDQANIDLRYAQRVK